MQNMNTNPSSTRDSTNLRFQVPFFTKINLISIFLYTKKWIKHPMNIALIIWLFFVISCLIILFLLMTGILNHTIQNSSIRKKWTEIFNQILNALFTIMCLYQHPRISHHLVLLFQWKPNDIVELRKIYCKNGTKKLNERTHMMFVVILLQITCFSQYGLCTLYWAYTSKTRPNWAQILFIVVGTGAPIIAALYTIFSPLGKRNESNIDEESQRRRNVEFKLYKKSVLVTSPEWDGGMFDCCDDLNVWCLSLFCVFCVFGWNMEMIGFGNMCVHLITFILLCSAPLVVFSVTALNINDGVIRYVVGIAGIVLCFCGFLYGGFWRIQMRKRFKIPADSFCFGLFNFGEFMRWLFCWSCALAQEVRTGNFYDVETDRFCRNESGDGVVVVSNLDSEEGSKCVMEEFGVEIGVIISEKRGEDELMRPPLQAMIKMDAGKFENLIGGKS